MGRFFLNELFLKIGNSQILLANSKRILRREASNERGLQRILRDVKHKEVFVVSVVPTLRSALKKLSQKNHLCLRLLEARDFLFKLPYSKNIGVDRVLNVGAARSETKASFVVIDIGTAMTVDFYDRKRGYRGGWIAAGPRPLSHALTEAGAKLPRFKFERRIDSPFGRSSYESLALGVQNQVLGLVLRALVEAEHQWGKDFQIYVTGGWARAVSRSLRTSRRLLLRPNLWLEGMKLLLRPQPR